jgi:hypothetical protein
MISRRHATGFHRSKSRTEIVGPEARVMDLGLIQRIFMLVFTQLLSYSFQTSYQSNFDIAALIYCKKLSIYAKWVRNPMITLAFRYNDIQILQSINIASQQIQVPEYVLGLILQYQVALHGRSGRQDAQCNCCQAGEKRLGGATFLATRFVARHSPLVAA